MVEQDRKDRLEAMLKRCGLPADSPNLTFKTFKCRGGLEGAYNAAQQMVSKIPMWLTLSGGVDVAKTHLLIAVCQECISRGVAAKYIYVPLLLDELRRGYGRQGDESYDNTFQFYLNVPMLALDDLGVQSSTPWVNEKLDTIIDYRAINRLSLMVTTNVPMNELPIRIASRLQRFTPGKVIVLDIPEYRLNKGVRDDSRNSKP